MARSKRAKSRLTVNHLKGGRRYWTNYYGEVVQIECACCHKVKPASAFHTNNFKKFNKQNYCIECNDERLRAKSFSRVEPVIKDIKPVKSTRIETVKETAPTEVLTEEQRKLLGSCLSKGYTIKDIDRAIEDFKKVRKYLQVIK